MQSLCRFELCELAAEIIGSELDTPNLTEIDSNKQDYEKARYLYVYFCHTHVNAGFPLIRRTLFHVYKYPKTVYQVFGRAYKRNKDQQMRFLIGVFKSEFDKRIKEYKSNNIAIRSYGEQLKMFN